eukprot:4027005-Karenia_brevis.AAC.1
MIPKLHFGQSGPKAHPKVTSIVIPKLHSDQSGPRALATRQRTSAHIIVGCCPPKPPATRQGGCRLSNLPASPQRTSAHISVYLSRGAAAPPTPLLVHSEPVLTSMCIDLGGLPPP